MSLVQRAFDIPFNRNRDAPKAHTTFNDYYGGDLKSERLVIYPSNLPNKKEMIEALMNARTEFKMLGCFCYEYVAEIGDKALCKKISELALFNSPRGQGFLSIALVTGGGASWIISDNIMSDGSDLDDGDMASGNDGPARKVLTALGNATLTGGTVNLVGCDALYKSSEALTAVENETTSLISVSEELVLDPYTSTGSVSAAMARSWVR